MVNPILKQTFDDFADVFKDSARDIEAFDVPLPMVVDLWTVRWGEDWVSGEEIKKDSYWNMQLLRLLNKELVEHLYLMDKQDTFYRLIKNDHGNN
jgi:hypothetical protein